MSRRFETGCTIALEHSEHALRADVELDGNPEIHPGDRVRIHGDAVQLPWGERLTLRRTATIERASLLGRAWTRATAYLGITELYEVSFSPGRIA